MLRIEEIVGAMDDEFRYALDALSDEALARLTENKTALRRMRPVGVSTAEAMEMIAVIQTRRREKRERAAEAERKRQAKSFRKTVTVRRRKVTPPLAGRFPTITLALPPAPPLLRLAAPGANGPAIRLPAPERPGTVIPLPPPPARTAGLPAKSNNLPRPFLPIVVALLAVALLLLG